MLTSERFNIFSIDKVVDELNKLETATLKNNAVMEKEEYKRYDKYLDEDTIQTITVAYLRKNKIIVEGSKSGIKVKSFKTLKKMKAHGMERGFPDLTITKWNGKNTTFYLELKTIKGILSQEQKAMLKAITDEHAPTSVSYGLYDAIYKIKKYLEGEAILWK